MQRFILSLLLLTALPAFAQTNLQTAHLFQ